LRTTRVKKVGFERARCVFGFTIECEVEDETAA
jgi:hypothetical protein